MAFAYRARQGGFLILIPCRAANKANVMPDARNSATQAHSSGLTAANMLIYWVPDARKDICRQRIALGSASQNRMTLGQASPLLTLKVKK